MPSITLKACSLEFPVFQGGARSLKKSLLRGVKRSFIKTGAVGGAVKQTADSMVVCALQDVSLHIGAGERVGLVGHNGAGKTTLLRLIAGIYDASRGDVCIDGRVHALIDAHAGMNAELNGRSNIHLYALRLRLNRAQTQALEAEVEQFAELGAFLDLPVRMYSSGMAIRLGFALATAPQTQILVMDEWFMAGDQHFQAKAKARLHRLIEQSDIVVFTSHALAIMQEWCTRIIWMEGGRIRDDGPPETVLAAYRASVA